MGYTGMGCTRVGCTAGNSPRVSTTAVSTSTFCYFWNSKLVFSLKTVKLHCL